MEEGTFEVILNLEITYEYGSERSRIFGEEFVKNNKDKCRLIYKDEEKEMKEYYEEFDNNNLIKFKLKFMNNIINMRCMFMECWDINSIKI